MFFFCYKFMLLKKWVVLHLCVLIHDDSQNNFLFVILDVLWQWWNSAGNISCGVVTLTLGSRPRQGFARVQAKKEARSHILCSRECRRMWSNEPSHYQVNSHFGSWSPNGLPNFQKAILGVKTHWIEKFFISSESFWNIHV